MFSFFGVSEPLCLMHIYCYWNINLKHFVSNSRQLKMVTHIMFLTILLSYNWFQISFNMLTFLSLFVRRPYVCLCVCPAIRLLLFTNVHILLCVYPANRLLTFHRFLVTKLEAKYREFKGMHVCLIKGPHPFHRDTI